MTHTIPRQSRDWSSFCQLHISWEQFLCLASAENIYIILWSSKNNPLFKLWHVFWQRNKWIVFNNPLWRCSYYKHPQIFSDNIAFTMWTYMSNRFFIWDPARHHSDRYHCHVRTAICFSVSKIIFYNQTIIYYYNFENSHNKTKYKSVLY